MRWTTSSSTAVYYHRNQQYSVTALTDASGSVLERYAYTAYGVPTICNPSGVTLQNSNIAIRHTYTGREWDNDIQQYHYRARMYDPALGRFCSRDPIGYKGGENQYCYVMNASLIGMDAFGLCHSRLVDPEEPGTYEKYRKIGKTDGFWFLGNTNWVENYRDGWGKFLFGVRYRGKITEVVSDDHLEVTSIAELDIGYIGFVRPYDKSLKARSKLTCQAECKTNDFAPCIGRVKCSLEQNKKISKDSWDPFWISSLTLGWFEGSYEPHFEVLTHISITSINSGVGAGMQVDYLAFTYGLFNAKVKFGASGTVYGFPVGLEGEADDAKTFFDGPESPSGSVTWECCKKKRNAQ